jgi:hypothetical protein
LGSTSYKAIRGQTTVSVFSGQYKFSFMGLPQLADQPGRQKIGAKAQWRSSKPGELAPKK